MHNKEYGNQAIEINDTILGMKLYLAVNDNSTTDNIKILMIVISIVVTTMRKRNAKHSGEVRILWTIDRTIIWMIDT